MLWSIFMMVGSGATSLAAQVTPWQRELGLNLNFTVTTIGDDLMSTAGIPASNGFLGVGGVAGIYGVFPVNDRVAIEPSLGVSDASFSGITITTANAGARVLYSAWRGFYIGAGPSFTLLKFSGDQFSILGIDVAIGYRRHLTGALMGRAELYYEAMGQNGFFGNETSSSVGLKVGLGVTTALVAPVRARDDAMWPLAIGIQGGYARTSSEAFEATNFSIPGSQTALVLANYPVPGVAPLFFQIPLGERMALEPSLGLTRYDMEGGGEVSVQALGIRVDYAFGRALYGAVSFDHFGYGGDVDVDGSTGFGVAGGVRFPVSWGLTGRAEVSWRRFSGDEGLLGEFTVTGLSFAVVAPLR